MAQASASYAQKSRELITYNYRLRIMEELFLQKYEARLLEAPPGTNGTIIYNIGHINFQTTTLDLIYTISIEGSTRKRIVARAEEVTMTTETSESTTPRSESTVQETTEQMTSDTTVSKEE